MAKLLIVFVLLGIIGAAINGSIFLWKKIYDQNRGSSYFKKLLLLGKNREVITDQKYQSLSKKLSKDCVYRSSKEFICYELKNQLFVIKTNSNKMAETLYLMLVEKKDKSLKKLLGIKSMVVKTKEKKLFFLVCKEPDIELSEIVGYDQDVLKRILQDPKEQKQFYKDLYLMKLGKLASAIKESFLEVELPVEIEYLNFLKLLLQGSSIVTSIMLSIEQTDTLNMDQEAQERYKETIFSRIYRYYKKGEYCNAETVNGIVKYWMVDDRFSKKYLPKIKSYYNSRYMEGVIDWKVLDKMPLFLRIRMLQYAYYPDSLTVDDIFMNPFNKERMDQFKKYKSVIWDESSFHQSIKLKQEDKEKKFFIDSTNQNNYVIEFKEQKIEKKFEELKESMSIYFKEDSFFTFEYKTGHTFFSYSSQYSQNVKKLKKVFGDLSKKDMVSLVLLIIKADSNIFQFYVDRQMKEAEREKIVSFFLVTKDYTKLFLTNFSDMTIIPTEDSYQITREDVLFEVIRQYYIAKWNSPEIWQTKFAKMMPPRMLQSVISYIDTGMMNKEACEYNQLIDPKYLNNILLVEELEYSPLLEQFRLIEGVAESHCNTIESNKTSLYEENSTKYNVESLSLEKVKAVLGGSLNNVTLEKILQYEGQEEYYQPVKIVIDQNLVKNGEYQIVGYVFSQSRVYRLLDVLKNTSFQQKEAFQLLMKLFGLAIKEPGNGLIHLEEIVVDEELKVYWNFFEIRKSNTTNTKSKKLDALSIYDDLIRQLKVYFPENIVYFKLLEFFDVAEIAQYSSIPGIVNKSESKMVPKEQLPDLIEEKISKLQFCKDHNKWFIKSICPICQKLYFETPIEEIKELVYSDGIANCYHSVPEKQYIYRKFHLRQHAQNAYIQAKFGLEKEKFEKFSVWYPSKIAVTVENGKKKFVGLIYPYIDLSNVVDVNQFHKIEKMKFILALYKHLLCYIQEGEFISSDSVIYETMFMHKGYPGKIIIPDIYLLDTSVQESKKNKQEAIQKEKEKFSQFLLSYLSKDVEIEEEQKNGNQQVKDLLQKIREDIQKCEFHEAFIYQYLELNANRCLVHGTRFPKGNHLCEYCHLDGITEEDVIFLTNEELEEITNKGIKFKGGEAALYLYQNDGLLLKLFYKKKKVFRLEGNEQVQEIQTLNTKFKSKILGKILSKRNLIEEFNKKHKHIEFVLPWKVVYEKDKDSINLVGEVQELKKDTFKISKLNEKKFREDTIHFSNLDVLDILISVCEAIEYLHSIQIFIGDLNGSNILVDKNKKVYFIDFDGMSIDEMINTTYTFGYIYPPTVKNGSFSPKDDWYSIAIQAFYYLTYCHPFNGVCENKDIPTELVERMEKGYSLLGNHGIPMPKICTGWDNMPVKLQQYFLQTFEEERRESLLPFLKEYRYMFSKRALRRPLKVKVADHNKEPISFFKVNRKREVMVEISELSYIDKNEMLIIQEEEVVHCKFFKRCEVDGDFLLIRAGLEVFVIDEKKKEVILSSEIKYSDYRLYGHWLVQYDLQLHLKELIITDLHTKLKRKCRLNDFYQDALVKNHGEVIMLTDGSLRYSMDSSILRIEQEGRSSLVIQNDQYDNCIHRILYDPVTERVVILSQTQNNNTIMTIINVDNTYVTYEKETINKSCLSYNNQLYYAENGKIMTVNLDSGETKSLSCEKVTAESTIHWKNNKWLVINKNELYVLEKK